MFKKSENEASTHQAEPPRVPDPAVRTRNVSVIGPTLRFKGELTANEDLIIEGQIEGKISHQDKNLTVGKQGRVKANIHANAVEVLGEVEGDNRGDDIVRLAKTANVQGNIQCGRIVMEDGARFTGAIDMSSLAPESMQPSLTVADTASQAGSGGG